MRHKVANLIAFALLIVSSSRGFAQAPGYAEILDPQGGEAISGVYTIRGSASHPSFLAYQLSFAQMDDPMETWFLLGDPQTTPVQEGGIGLWETTGISDGEYRLRLEVFLENEQSIVTVVEGIRVRNRSTVETATALPVAAQVTATQSPPTKTPRPTPLPPASVDGTLSIQQGFFAGIILGLLFLSSLGIYLFMRRRARQRWGMMQMRQVLRNQDRRREKRKRR